MNEASELVGGKRVFSLWLLSLPLLLACIQCSPDRTFSQVSGGSGGGGVTGDVGAGRAGSAQGGTADGEPTEAGAGGGGELVAECTVGDATCEGLVPLDCWETGRWVARHAGCATACFAGQCADCAEGPAVCKDGGVQACAAGNWTTLEVCEKSCEDGACVSACTEGSLQCNGTRWLQKCVGGSYVDDTECPFLCNAGECVGECAPDSRRCNPAAGNEAQTCNASGTWAGSEPCPDDTHCVEGACKPCEPGARRCSDAGPQACSEAGEWVNQGACVAPTAACLAGLCVACPPGEKRCGSGGIEQCQADGKSWLKVQTCAGATPVCLESSKTCGRCAQGDTQCFNNEVQTCDGQGAWKTSVTCSGTTPRCVGGACAQCDPAAGERRCETQTKAQGCGTTGSWGAATTCSGDKALCREDLNFACGCQENQRRCKTNSVPEVCQGGAWVAQSTCSGVLNYCLPETGRCVDCVPGTAECQSGTAFECTAQGSFASLKSCAGPGINCGGCDLGEPCQAATDCDSGFCVSKACAVCQPGQRRCQGNVPQLCSAAGAWTNQSACSGATPQCLPSTGQCVQCLSGTRGCGTCGGGTQSCNASNQWGTCTNEPNLQSSNAHCGTCNNACASGKSCQAGACGCNTGTHSCGSACYGDTDPDRCGMACLDCSSYHGTTNTCVSKQCACKVASLACGANVPTCSSWDFNTGTLEGWRVGDYDAASSALTTGVSTVVNNGSPVLTASFAYQEGQYTAAFAVDMCPNGAIINPSNYVLKYDVFFKTTGGSRFSPGGNASSFLANGGAPLTSCQPFFEPGSDEWLTGSCANLPQTLTSLQIVFRLSSWSGEIYLDNIRFEPK
jgi:hypothetical protein